MAEAHPYQITSLGDAALLVQFGNTIDEGINQKVLHLFRKLQALQLPYITDVVPAYSSLAVYYDVYQLLQKEKGFKAFEFVAQLLKNILHQPTAEEVQSRNAIQIPVCYAPAWAPDIEAVALQKNLSIEDVISLHTTPQYTVYMIGFLPGFAYMGKVDSRIAVERHVQPRLQIEAGSVGIAGLQTGIYPLASPGGWQIIGRTPLSLFQKEQPNPVRLQPGDKVQFYAITENEFKNY